MKKRTIALLMIALVTAYWAGQASLHAAGTIVGSAHDFSGTSWAQQQICLPCHTPHKADTTVTPLWNHQLSNATYTTYTSPYLLETPGTPGASSKLCLSCHDGTVAVDSYGGRTGNVYISQQNNIGTDLSNDHPIAITYGHKNPANCANCHWSGATLQLPFYGGKVECATCHDPHNKGEGEKLLRITMNGSQLCLFCHGK
jgi:predicted CXXCH cytochrome family protein